MKKKIKVLQIVGSMNNGGVESYVMSHYRVMHDDYEFTFLCFDDSRAIPKEEIESLGGKIIIIPAIKHLFKFNKALDKVLKENEFDIIHSHLNTLSVFPLRIAKKNKCPIRIAHSHSVSSKKEFVRHLIKSILKLFSKKYANVFFACSEQAARFQYGNKIVDQGKVHVLNVGIDVDRYRFNDEYRKDIRKSLNIKDDQYVVGTIGRMCVTKNQKYILEIAKKNKDVTFLIVGGGELENELKEQVKENNLSNVQVVVPEGEAYKYYSAFDMFVLPSLYEGFGIVALEAETNGLYLILSEFVGRKVLVSEYGVYLPIEEDSIDKWNEVINTKPTRKECVDKIIDAKFDIQSTAKELSFLYKELLNDK